MNCWIVNIESKNVSINRLDSSYVFRINSGRRVKIRRNDQILFHASGIKIFFGVFSVVNIERLESIEDGGFPFEGQAEDIESVGVRHVYNISLKEIDSVKFDGDLSDLKYSLGFVRRMDNPAVHFRQPYRRITRFDFETISSGRVFWSRTGYFSLFNALPATLRLRFELEEALAGNTTSKNDYLSKFEGLSDFVRRTVMSVGSLLQDAEKRWRELQVTKAPDDINSFGEIYFSTENGSSEDSAGRQLRYFRELFQVFGSTIEDDDLMSSVVAAATGENEVASARLFEQYFAQL